MSSQDQEAQETIRFASYTEEEEEAWKRQAEWYDAGGSGDGNADKDGTPDRPDLLLLVGPACAGKSTFSRILGRVLRGEDGGGDEGKPEEKPADVPPIKAMLMDIFPQNTQGTKPKAFLNLDGDVMRDAHQKWQEYVRNNS